MTFLALLAVALALAYASNRIYRSGKRESFLPPGPATLPVLGNIHIFPRVFAHFQYVHRLSI